MHHLPTPSVASEASLDCIDAGSADRPSDQAGNGVLDEEPPVGHSTQWERQIVPSLATAQPPAFQGITGFRQQFVRQILGLNPFKTSYFALYRCLDDAGSKAILIMGVLLAIAAGVPLRTYS